MIVLHVLRIARDISYIFNVDQLSAYGNSPALAHHRSWGSCKKQNKLGESMRVFDVKSCPPVPNADDATVCTAQSIRRNANRRSWRIEPNRLLAPGLKCREAECSGPVILVMHGKVVMHGRVLVYVPARIPTELRRGSFNPFPARSVLGPAGASPLGLKESPFAKSARAASPVGRLTVKEKQTRANDLFDQSCSSTR